MAGKQYLRKTLSFADSSIHFVIYQDEDAPEWEYFQIEYGDSQNTAIWNSVRFNMSGADAIGLIKLGQALSALGVDYLKILDDRRRNDKR